jgi:hypothetical protein
MAAILFVARIHPFLAVTERVDADILVVEGWIHLYAIRASVDEFRSGRYQRIYTTGGPVIGSGGYTNDFNTAASVGGYLLRGAGMPLDQVQIVPSRVMARDRTFSSAVTLRKWFEEKGIMVRSINVVTESWNHRRPESRLRRETLVAFQPGSPGRHHRERWLRVRPAVWPTLRRVKPG